MGGLQSRPEDNLTQEEINELKETFQMFDDDGSGTISVEELGQEASKEKRLKTARISQSKRSSKKLKSVPRQRGSQKSRCAPDTRGPRMPSTSLNANGMTSVTNIDKLTPSQMYIADNTVHTSHSNATSLNDVQSKQESRSTHRVPERSSSKATRFSETSVGAKEKQPQTKRLPTKPRSRKPAQTKTRMSRLKTSLKVKIGRKPTQTSTARRRTKT